MTLATHSPPARPPPRRAKDRDYISYSAIKTYQDCPLKYFFRYVAGLPEETVSASLVFGSAIHRAIEHHFRELLAGKQLRVEFTVLTKTKDVAVEQHGLQVDPARVDRTKRTIERVWNAIQAQHYYPAPSVTGCAGCPFHGPCRKWCG